MAKKMRGFLSPKKRHLTEKHLMGIHRPLKLSGWACAVCKSWFAKKNQAQACEDRHIYDSARGR